MKTSWIERELGDVYAGIDSEHQKEKFHVCDIPNGFLLYCEASPNIKGS
jgi:hypothetical protein